MRISTLKKRLAILFACMLCLSLFVASGFAQDKRIEWPKTLVLATPFGGGTSQMVSQAIAQFIEKETPIQRVITQPMGGPSVWLPRMAKGEVDMALHSGPDVLNAMFARENYAGKEPATFVRTLLPGHNIGFVALAVPSAKMTSISDLKGKIVFTKDPGNPMFEQITNVMLASAGMTQKDLKASLTRVNTAETAGDLIEGRADGNIGTIQPMILMEVVQAKGDCTIIGLNEQEKAAARLPEGYFFMDIPADSPEFRNPHEVKNAVAFKTNIYCTNRMSPEVAYEITKILFDNKAQWESAHALAKQWGVASPDLPLMHDGAIRYFKEKGAWTPEVDAWMKLQAERLSQMKK